MADENKPNDKNPDDKKEGDKKGDKKDDKKKVPFSTKIWLIVGAAISIFLGLIVLFYVSDFGIPEVIRGFNLTLTHSGQAMMQSTAGWEMTKLGIQAEGSGFLGVFITLGVYALIGLGTALLIAGAVYGMSKVFEELKRKSAEEKKKTAAATATS
jgi:hypothetical protein